MHIKNIWRRIESRIVLPGDSETLRSQKMLALGIILISVISTSLNGLAQYNSGLQAIGLTNLLLAAALLVAFVMVVVAPRLYTAVGVSVLLFSLLCNLLVHLFGGGFISGLMLINWTIVSVVFAVLFVGRRAVLLVMAAYVLAIIAAGYFDPWARGRLPDLAPERVIQVAVTNMIILGLITAGASLYLFNQIERYRRRADDLLLNILPAPIAGRLKEEPETIADGHDEVTVLFADIVDFTHMSAGADPVAVVGRLNAIFSDFDVLAARHGLEKIKTIGDAYMVAGGLPEPRPDHCQAVAAFALDMLTAASRHTSWSGDPIRLRVGMNTGPVVAGVIGRQKFIYDLWGDAVNVASRMEANGLHNEIQVTAAVKARLASEYDFVEREPIHVKGKGLMVTYLLRPRF